MLHSTKSRILAMFGVTALAVAGLPAAAAGDDDKHDDNHGDDVKVIASGLNSPRGLVFGPDGALYVAESGKGGDGPCFEGPEGPSCFGESGSVTRISMSGDQSRVLTGMPSIAAKGTGEAGLGPSDVSFHKDQMFVTVGLGLDLDVSKKIPALDDMGQLVKADPHENEWKTVADLADFEDKFNPTGDEENVNPNSVVDTPHRGQIVADAGANDLLLVRPNGKVKVLATFPNVMVDAPPNMGLPPQVEMDFVPTSVARGPKGALYVGQLTGFPFPVGGASVHRVMPNGDVKVRATGFTNIIDIAIDEKGRLYVLEIFKNGLLSGDPTGALIRVGKGGMQHEIMAEGLITPGGLVLHGDHAFVSNCGTCAGGGEVLKIDLD